MDPTDLQADVDYLSSNFSDPADRAAPGEHGDGSDGHEQRWRAVVGGHATGDLPPLRTDAARRRDPREAWQRV